MNKNERKTLRKFAALLDSLKVVVSLVADFLGYAAHTLRKLAE